MKYGYARVSTYDQNRALQLAALKKAGCQAVFKDEGLSGATTKRPLVPDIRPAVRPQKLLTAGCRLKARPTAVTVL